MSVWNRISTLEFGDDQPPQEAHCFICFKKCLCSLVLPEHNNAERTFFYVCKEHESDHELLRILRDNDLIGLVRYMNRHFNDYTKAQLESLK